MSLYSNGNDHRCPVCGHVERISKRKAVAETATVIPITFVCADCGRTSPTKAGLVAHQRAHKAPVSA